ncbi:MAG TPA: HlyD family efflux transporter periplasmic adaptor subunit [Caulifigura sp.]|nr:HlyD family efflux transporter periplasmic adaptor subunit [Caulifigura sp.]
MSDAVRWRLRPDLRWETIHSGGSLLHVARDPVSGQFFQFDAREFSILRLLDGLRGPVEVLAAIRQSRPDELFSTDVLLRFLADARRNGLLLLSGAASFPPSEPSRIGAGWNILAWKLPLFHPEAAIAALRPVTAFLFSRTASVAWLAIVVSAIVLVCGRWDDVASRWPDGRAWGTPSMLLTVLGVLFACKVAHELAHAMTADRFGVRVQECGLMLFYFLPSFYCDVSDAWLVRAPRKRILISAAGMLVELGLAGAATWLWWFSQPGPMQSVFLAVMVTGSVNTLLLNGNPLMRFDGYFVLVDLLGMPNLAARSASWWRAAWERLAYGIPGEAGSIRDGVILASYGVASFVYRLCVVAAVLWGFHTALSARGAGVIAGGLAIVVVLGLLHSGGRFAIGPWRDPMMRRVIHRGRAASVFSGVLLLLALAAIVPVPRSVEADIIIEPLEATSVFVHTPGALKSILPAGSRVKTGDRLASLDDGDTIRRLNDLKSQRALAEKKLESARVRRTIDADAGREIPALMEALAAVEDRLTLAQRAAAELDIVSPGDGILLPPPNTPHRSSKTHEATFWEGTPFDESNRGCTLRQGTCLAIVATSDELRAVAYISQRRIELVRPGQRCRIAIDGMSHDARTGVVDEIAPAPVEELPRELTATARIPVAAGAGLTEKPLEPMYRVTIRLDDQSLPAVVGSLGTVRVTCDRATLAARLLSLIVETFRVDL